MRISRLTMATLICVLGTSSLPAKNLPSDVCSLLTPAQLEKTLGQPYAAPEKSTAPPPYAGHPAGTQCEYNTQKGPAMKVVLIAYIDRSPAEAKQTFDRLSAWYRPKSKPAVGDSAYFDANHAIHVLKDRVRYYIAIEAAGTSKNAPYTPWASGPNSPSQEKQVKDLAAAVAEKI